MTHLNRRPFVTASPRLRSGASRTAGTCVVLCLALVGILHACTAQSCGQDPSYYLRLGQAHTTRGFHGKRVMFGVNHEGSTSCADGTRELTVQEIASLAPILPQLAFADAASVTFTVLDDRKHVHLTYHVANHTIVDTFRVIDHQFATF